MNKVFFNSNLLLIARVIQMSASFVVMMVLLPRYLTLDEFGAYSAIIASVGAVMTVSFFGIGKLLIRDIARDPRQAPKVAGIAFSVRTLLLLAASVIAFALMYAQGIPDVATAATIFLAILFFSLDSYSMLFFNVFQAYERMYFEPAIMLISSLFQVGAIWGVVQLDLGFNAVFVVMVLSGMIRVISGCSIMIRSFVFPVLDFNASEFWCFVKESSIVGFGVFLYLNLFRVSTIILHWIHGNEETAYYQSVNNLVIQLQVVPTVLTVAMFPGLARRFAMKNTNKKILCSRVIRYLAIFGASIAWPLFCLSDECVAILGEKYAFSAVPLRILAWTSVGLFVDMGCNNILVAAGKQNLALLVVGIATVINLLVAFILIPDHASVGAAVTALIVDGALFIISTGVILWWCKGLPRLFSCFVGLALSTGAALFVTLVVLDGVNRFAAVFLGGVVYLLLLIATRTVRVGEVIDILHSRT